MRAFDRGEGNQFHTSFDADFNQIDGDADRLQQVFCNLLSNAVKFTPQHGQIEIRVQGNDSHCRNRNYAIRGRASNPNFCLLFLSDFVRRTVHTREQVGGLGLGLAIVRHLVELHGGTVDVTSDGENHGARFYRHTSCFGNDGNSKFIRRKFPSESSERQ